MYVQMYGIWDQGLFFTVATTYVPMYCGLRIASQPSGHPVPFPSSPVMSTVDGTGFLYPWREYCRLPTEHSLHSRHDGYGGAARPPLARGVGRAGLCNVSGSGSGCACMRRCRVGVGV